MKRLLCLLLACAALLALCACGEAEEDAPWAVSLWYVAGDPLAGALCAAAEAYNASRKDGALPVRPREFETEAQLLAGLNTAAPDLLLCPHTLAFSLDERGLLTAAGEPVAYPEALSARSEAIGRGLLPLGSRVQLLLSDEPDAPTKLSQLCETAARCGTETGKPYLRVDSFTDLICQAVLGSGEFHADRTKDCFNAAFREAWNALAEAAFCGGLTSGAGATPAAIVWADSLTDGVSEGRTLRALDFGKAPLLGDLRCLAVMAREGRQARGTAGFLSWLFSGSRASQLALDAGLIPALPGAEARDARAELLLALREQPLWLPDGGSDYIQNRAAFEKDFRALLDLLK